MTPAAVETDVDEGWDLIPAGLREKVESARARLQGDRRRVVVVFADLEGYTAYAESRDPEELTLLVGRVLEDLAGAVQEYGGYVDKYIGDAIMALFGAPVAHEDDAERAVLAGLEMIDRVRRRREAGLPLALRVGIHSGEVVAAQLGGGGRPQYTVIGDAVNVAARLEHEAAANSVLVSESVQVRIAQRFQIEALTPVNLKGRAEPVRPYRVVGLLERTPLRTVRGPFVGRMVELAALEAFLARGSGALAIEAEPGMGKSRLAREAIERFDGTVVEIGFAAIHYPGEREAPAEAFVALGGMTEAQRLLGSDTAQHEDGLQALARAAEGAALEGHDAAAERQNRWFALGALARAAARERPLALLVEDVHWADETAREFLSFLVRELADSRAAIVMTTRPGTTLPAGVERMGLAPLDSRTAEKLVAGLAGRLPSETREQLLRRAEGNPLFLEELARALGEQGPAVVPGTIEGIVRSRIDRLDPDASAALQAAAVLGGRFPVDLLERLYRLERPVAGFPAALEVLVESGFLEVGGRDGGFRHALLQEVAYGGLLLGVRKVLHESAARLGETWFAAGMEAEAPFFAHHWWEAGLKDRAFPHMWAAGRAAQAAYDLPSAERWLLRAAEALEEHPEGLAHEDHARFAENLAGVLVERGELDRAEAWSLRLEEEGSRYARARAAEFRGRIAWYRGRLGEAEARFEAGLAVEPEDERLIATLHNHLGVVGYYTGRPDFAFTHHAEALRIRERLDDRLGVAKSHTNIGNLLYHFRHDLAGAEERFQRAFAIAAELGHRQEKAIALNNIGFVARERGEWARGFRISTRCVRLFERIGQRQLVWLAHHNAARCEIALGRIADAVARLERCRTDGDTALEPVNRVNTRLYLFEAWLRALADDRAEAALTEARRLAEELDAEEMMNEVWLGEGRLLAARGRWEEAAVAFEKAADDAARRGNVSLARLAVAHRARARARAGEPPERKEVGAESELHGPSPFAALLLYLEGDAMAARGPSLEAAATLEDAAARAAALDDPALERAALASLAKVHFGRGDEPAARDALAGVARATLLLADGLPADLRAGFLDHPRGLTP